MSAYWPGRCLVAIALLTLAPGIARAQKDDIDNDVKNIPKELGATMESTAPPASTDSPLPKPRTIEPAGTYTNQFSGVQFPKRVGEFLRANVMIYDTEARNVGAAYQRKTGGMLVNAVSVFSYPVPPRLAGRGTAAIFEQEKLGITSQKTNARLVREEPYRASNGSIGDFAEYEIVVSAGKGGSATLRTRLYLFEDKGWLLKVLSFYSNAKSREGLAQTENFLRAFGTAVVRNAGGN